MVTQMAKVPPTTNMRGQGAPRLKCMCQGSGRASVGRLGGEAGKAPLSAEKTVSAPQASRTWVSSDLLSGPAQLGLGTSGLLWAPCSLPLPAA